MANRIVVLASGSTEQRALPHLLRHLAGRAIRVRIPPGHRALTPAIARSLVAASWWDTAEDERPEKFVLLLDTDAKSPDEVVGEFDGFTLPPKVAAHWRIAVARRHLEAWFFADPDRLAEAIGRSLGGADYSQPDELENPKLHLEHLLGDRIYTQVVAGEISAAIDPAVVERNSPSFRQFSAAVQNGAPTNDSP